MLKREADGSYWLETPAERGRIEVEDAPFVAVEMDWSGDGPDQVLSFRTNVDQVVTAGPEHPIRVAHDILTCEPTPYITIRPATGAAAAGGADRPRGLLRAGGARRAGWCTGGGCWACGAAGGSSRSASCPAGCCD